VPGLRVESVPIYQGAWSVTMAKLPVTTTPA